MSSPTERAFTQAAPLYESFIGTHPHLGRLRHQVYDHLTRYLSEGAHILELNAGSGIDAAHLAGLGYHVHATDTAPGMLEHLQRRAETTAGLSVEACSLLTISQVSGAPYDAIFSNFGGLNCIPDLNLLLEQIPQVLKPGGTVTWVFMPPVCLWELSRLLTGRWRFALRRMLPQATARIAEFPFEVWYHNPQRLKAAFDPAFEWLASEGLAVFLPPADNQTWIAERPRLYHLLAGLDKALAARWPFHSWGDFIMMTWRYHG